MIGIPVNVNSVYIPIVPSGCLKGEFDSTYRIHLNGIISQEEFQNSIKRINHTISSNKILLFIGIIFLLSIINGAICVIIGGMKATDSHTYGFPTLIGIGLGLSIFGLLFFSFGCCTLHIQRVAQLRKAIAIESIKYSSRSPIPCSWRLDNMRYSIGGYRNHYNNQFVYHLVIDIGHSIVPGNGVYNSNQVTSEPILIFGRQENIAPPPYSDQSTEFCSQCITLRQDLTSKFCSSCGYSFNKH